jgi:hypothetical protein
MHHHRALAAALITTGLAPLSAQQVVSPSALTNAYGGINNSVPWGPPASGQGEMFAQQIDIDLMGTPRVLKGFAFRHSYTSVYTAKTLSGAVVKVGDAASMPASISATFASNWRTGSTATTVFTGNVVFPALPSYPRPPAPPDSPVPFTTPHVYLGNHPLLWEVSYTSATPLSPTQFYERGPGSSHVAGVLGTGCTISGGSSPMGSSGTTSGTALTDTLAGGPANTTAHLLIGDAASLLGGTLPLPIDLALIGSPGCSLNLNVLLSVPVATTATGGATFTLPYTMSPAVSGIRLRTQWVAIDATQLVRSSNGLDHGVPYNATTGKAWPQSRVHAYGFGPTPPATGTIEQIGVVTTWML